MKKFSSCLFYIMIDLQDSLSPSWNYHIVKTNWIYRHSSKKKRNCIHFVLGKKVCWIIAVNYGRYFRKTQTIWENRTPREKFSFTHFLLWSLFGKINSENYRLWVLWKNKNLLKRFFFRWILAPNRDVEVKKVKIS